MSKCTTLTPPVQWSLSKCLLDIKIRKISSGYHGGKCYWSFPWGIHIKLIYVIPCVTVTGKFWFDAPSPQLPSRCRYSNPFLYLYNTINDHFDAFSTTNNIHHPALCEVFTILNLGLCFCIYLIHFLQ